MPVSFQDYRLASPANLKLSCLRVYGGLHRFPRDEKLQTPPGPEGSNGSSGLGCRGVAGVGRHQ